MPGSGRVGVGAIADIGASCPAFADERAATVLSVCHARYICARVPEVRRHGR